MDWPSTAKVDAHGGVYFTDPNYHGNFQPEAVYYLDPQEELHQVAQGLSHPNGIALSPDGNTLYVAPETEGRIMAYDVQANGLLANGREFVRGGRVDGITVDQAGNLFAALVADQKIAAWNSDGGLLFEFGVPEWPSNLSFLSPESLYVTATTSVYRIILPEPSTDMLIARNNTTHFFNALDLINVPGGKAAVIPEPSTLALLPIAALELLIWGWRRRAT